MIDLDYSEDSKADVDANFVLTEKSGFSEIQATGEESTFSEDTFKYDGNGKFSLKNNI